MAPTNLRGIAFESIKNIRSRIFSAVQFDSSPVVLHSVYRSLQIGPVSAWAYRRLNYRPCRAG